MEIVNHDQRPGRPHAGHAVDLDKKPQQAKGEGVSNRESARQEMNRAILNASADVTLSAGNQPLQLLFRSAIESLNEILAPELGEGAIERAAENPDEFTPQNTAARIASFALNFYAPYQEQHPEMGEEESVNSFIELMTGAVEKGVNEARGILDGMGVLEGDIAENIDTTLALIRERFDEFRSSILGGDEGPQPDSVIEP